MVYNSWATQQIVNIILVLPEENKGGIVPAVCAAACVRQYFICGMQKVSAATDEATERIMQALNSKEA